MNVIEPIDEAVKGSLGCRIRRARLGRYLSLDQLAKELNVSKVTVWNWENNRTRPRYSRLEQLGEVLGIPVDALMTGARDAEQKVPDLISDCRSRIAASLGVLPENVEIKITFLDPSNT